MDPVTIIVAALIAGAAEAAKSTVSDAIKSGYEKLKVAISTHLGGTPHAQVLDGIERAPDAKKAEVATAVRATDAASDPAVMDAARALLQQIDPDGQLLKRYSLEVKGNVYGLVQGEHASVTMNFDTDDKPKPT